MAVKADCSRNGRERARRCRAPGWSCPSRTRRPARRSRPAATKNEMPATASMCVGAPVNAAVTLLPPESGWSDRRLPAARSYRVKLLGLVAGGEMIAAQPRAVSGFSMQRSNRSGQRWPKDAAGRHIDQVRQVARESWADCASLALCGPDRIRAACGCRGGAGREISPAPCRRSTTSPAYMIATRSQSSATTPR